jgi:hypothetical protein
VAFGDVNLAEQDIRGDYDPGAGGWPTIRYFNNVTGYSGKPYPKKTDQAMCDELGDEANMQSYVEEMGGVLLCSDFACLCSRKEGGECAKKEIDYYEKNKAAAPADLQSKLRILAGSLQKSGKKDEWMSQRVTILKLLVAIANEAANKEEL